jgi:hypothetical protein
MHTNQTHYQPPFPKNTENLKNSSTIKNWTQKFSPSKFGVKNLNLKNLNLDNSTLHTYKKKRGWKY